MASEERKIGELEESIDVGGCAWSLVNDEVEVERRDCFIMQTKVVCWDTRRPFVCGEEALSRRGDSKVRRRIVDGHCNLFI